MKNPAILALAPALLLLLLLPIDGDAQFSRGGKGGPVTDLADAPFNRPEPNLEWDPPEHPFFPSLLGLRTPGARRIQTKYFSIYFADGEQTARRIAEFADDVFEDISSHYPTSIDRFAPVHVFVDNSVDYLGNAYSDYINNFVMFWTTPADFQLRGTKDWVRDTFTHELTHHITLKAAHKGLPFWIGIVSMGRSNENPDYNFTLPLYHMAMPGWYSEGMAQYESRKHGGDFWDTHRDMLLRMATLEGKLLSYSDMGVFAKDGYDSELVYNQGFAILNYAEQEYGEEAVRAMSEHRPLVNFKSAVKKNLGVSAGKLYRDWVNHLQAAYNGVADSVRSVGEREGEAIFDGGSVDTNPVYSPDGTKVAFLSNGHSDYGSLTQLKVLDLTTRKVRTVAEGRKYGKYVDNRLSWTPDGTKLVYTKSPGGRWDIFTYDLLRDKERRLTVGLRGRDSAVSPNGKHVAFVGNGDGTSNLGIVSINGTKVRYLTNNNDGTQYYSPRWSPDGSKILFSVFRGEDRDVAVIRADATPLPKEIERKRNKKKGADKAETADEDSTEVLPDSLRIAREEKVREDSLQAFPDTLAFANNAGFQALIRSDADERDPVWLPDGSGVVFSSNRDGIFNVYSHDLATGRQEQITNVVGGAFCPSVSPDGEDVVYSGYHASNYSLYRVKRSLGREVASTEALERDYRGIYSGGDVSDLYDVGRYSPRLQSYGVIPILVLGPTFVGNRFGLDQLSVGAQTAWGDMLGSDVFLAGFTAGKNLKRKTDLNSEFYASYRRTLSPILTEQRTYVPRLTIGASRQTINSLIDRGVVSSFRDTTQGTLITVVDSQQVIIPNVTQDLRLSMTQEDDYKHMFGDFVVGTEIMIGRSQMLSLHVGHRRYSENLHLLQVIQDSSRLYQTDPQAGTLVEITDTLRAMGVVGQEEIALDDFLYQDLDFFRSTDYGVTWRYGRFEPAKDRFVNPRGGRAITLRYRRINATITDSLALSADLNQDLVPDPTPSEVSPTIYRSDDVKLGLNEYTFSWNEFVPLFGRTTLGLQAFLGYKDQPIKKSVQGGGTFEGVFYYPLRYYLGGFGTLRGYPYFALAGGKALFCRATFTFPILQKAGQELPPLFFDKIYGTFFVETGATSDFESLRSWWDSGNRFNRSAFLTDWGFELRMQMFSNYRLPLFGYIQIAFPTRDRIGDRNDPGTLFDIDNRRIYFGLSI